MADALVLGASGQPCGFKSHYPQALEKGVMDFDKCFTKELDKPLRSEYTIIQRQEICKKTIIVE